MAKRTRLSAPDNEQRPKRRARHKTAPLLKKSPDASEVRSHRELAQAIFSGCDPVKVGRELLESGSEKGASVRARVFETLANWQFGAPARTGAPSSSSSTAGVRIIWNIPGPPRESEEPE